MSLLYFNRKLVS